MTPRKSSPLSLQIAADILKTVGPVDEKKLMQPHSVWATSSHLYITDFHNHRLLIYDSLKPQPHDEPRQISRISGSDIPNLNEPSNVVVHNDRLYLADFGNKRLLIFDSPLPENGQTPTVINSISNHQPQTFNSANGLFITDSAVYMTDSFNNRLIVWDTPTPTDHQPAHVFAHPGGTAIDSLNGLRCPYIINNRCYLDDLANNRLLIFDSPLPKDGDIPLVVSKFAGIDPPTLDGPVDICASDSHLFILDYFNARILIFDTFDLTDGLAPVAVIDRAGGSETRPHKLQWPRDMHICEKYIYITDFGTDRLLIYNRSEVLKP